MVDKTLLPKYQKSFGDHWILWFEKSNSYSVIDKNFKLLLDTYFEFPSTEEFEALLTETLNENEENASKITQRIDQYLKQCQTKLSHKDDKTFVIDTTKREIQKKIQYSNKTIILNFDSEWVLKFIYPALSHLETNAENSAQTDTFDIYSSNNNLLCFKNEVFILSAHQDEYHLLQGKFIMELLNSIHNKEESDWIGTFHGCTIAYEDTAFLFVGKSGKGKSTLSSILASHGFELIADDVSPLLSEDLHIYDNPMAISVKSGAFEVLKNKFDEFDNLPTTTVSSLKGPIKYVPCLPPKKSNYPCKAIISVNYNPNSNTELKTMAPATILETLIPDSWISRKPEHAKQFLDWLDTMSFYELTYSNADDMSYSIKKLFSLYNTK